MFLVLQNANGHGLCWALGPDPLVIGRSEGCDIRLLDAAMSRRHARIWIDGASVRVEDLRSSNATYINGVPIKENNIYFSNTLAA